MTAVYQAPIAAFVPLIIFVGGPTVESRLIVVFLFAVFEIAISTFEGANSAPEELTQVATSFGASGRFVLTRVLFPYDLLNIFTGLRLGMGRAIKGMILAELVVDFSNLGAIIFDWQGQFRLGGVLSIALLLVVLGIVLTRTIQALERYVVTW